VTDDEAMEAKWREAGRPMVERDGMWSVTLPDGSRLSVNNPGHPPPDPESRTVVARLRVFLSEAVGNPAMLDLVTPAGPGIAAARATDREFHAVMRRLEDWARRTRENREPSSRRRRARRS